MNLKRGENKSSPLFFFWRMFMIIATISESFSDELIDLIIRHPRVSAVRFNTGVSSPNTSYETLSQLKVRTTKPIWIDLKCRQLRVINWCTPYYGEVELNHNIEVELPAEIYFRGVGWTDIKAVKNNKVYLKHPPQQAIGKGQSVNISSNFMQIKGYFTEDDLKYIAAAQSLRMKHFMLSFYEGEDDLRIFKNQLKDVEGVNVGLKIESQKGVEALNDYFPSEGTTLVVARDDMFTNLKENPIPILSLYEKCIELDKNSIVASGFFSGLENKGICVSDISDIHLLHLMGYKNFMFSDGICLRHFREAVSVLELYERR